MTNKEIIFGAVYKLQKGANGLLKSVKGGMHGEYFAFQNDQAYYYFLPINAKAGEIIAEEENSDGKGISLALRPKEANSEGVHLMNRDELRECQEALNALWAYYEEGVDGSMWFRHNLDILQKNIHMDDEIID